MHGPAPRSEAAALPDASALPKESAFLLVVALAFALIWGYGLLRPHDAHFLLAYLVPPLLAFNLKRRRTILAVVTASIVSTAVEFVFLRSAEDAEAQAVTAIFSVTLQSMVGYLALRQWRILVAEQRLRAQSDAELRAVASDRDALGRLARLLAEHAPAAMAQLSPDLKYVMANPAYLAFIRAEAGDARLEIVGRRWDEFAPPDEGGARWHAEVARYIRHGLPFTSQAQASRSRDGRLTYWDWTVWPVKDAAGRTESVLLLGTEITDRIVARRQLEAALADAWTERNKLEAVIENITDAVFISDARSHRVVRVNSAAARLLGYEDRAELEEELRSNPLPLDSPQAGPSAGSGGWTLAALGGEAQSGVHRVWRRRDGTPVHVVVGASPVRDSGGAVALAVSTAHDVTRLLEVQGELERSNRTKDVFLAMLSHELRTPLTPVLGWVRILRKQQQPDARLLGQGLEVIERNARLQAQLVDDLLDLSRVAMGKIELDRRPADLNEIVRRALETVRGGLEEKRLAVELELAPAPLPVNADEPRLEQVFWNLLSNAVKFTPVGGRVRVRSGGAGERCVVEVSDDGVGIPADVLPSVFAPFRQADSSVTRRHGGLGIGLAIAQSLVEMHGGQISAASAGEGRGATFTVSLPAHATSHPPREFPPITPRPARFDGLRVLVLEDSCDTRTLLGLVLSSHGCEVTLADSVGAGLRAAREKRPDLIISDIGMPDADGFEFVRRLRAEAGFARTPVIALSGYAMESDRRRSAEAGFDLHLPKPIDPDALLAAVERLRPRQAARHSQG
jgi:PAS domain S-box-containing protein